MASPLHGPAAAGQYLRELLMTEPYRQVWQRLATHRSEHPNLSAVSRVVARHLVSTGERPEHVLNDHRVLKDRVSRALRGTVLTPSTLRWFVQAFSFSEAEEQELWRRLSRPSGASVTIRGRVGDARGPVPTYRTLSVHELHDIGPDRRPRRHRSITVIEAVADQLSALPYAVDDTIESVRVLHGGRLRDGELQLSRRLHKGETASVEYVLRYASREAPVHEYRRTAVDVVRNLAVRVRFHPAALPGQVWWCIWPDTDAGPSYQEEVELDADLVAHRFVGSVSQAVVGFRWAW